MTDRHARRLIKEAHKLLDRVESIIQDMNKVIKENEGKSEQN